MDKWEKYRIFVGERADYYIERFKKFEETGGAVSWNWAAFILGVVWMFYRKMHLYGIVIFTALIALGFFIAVLSPGNKLLAFGLQLWVWFGFGAFGNYLYYTFVKNKVSQIENSFPDEKTQKIILAKSGGTSISSAVLFVMAVFLVQMLLYYQK